MTNDAHEYIIKSVNHRVINEIGPTAAHLTSPMKTRSQTARATGVYPALTAYKEKYSITQKNNECEGCGTGPDPPPKYNTETYPLMEVANPHFGINGDQERTIDVYRPWTESECAEACKSLGDYVTDVKGWIERHKQLRDSYRLNGTEVEQMFKRCLIYNWNRVRRVYTGKAADGNVLGYGTAELNAQIQPVYDSMTEVFQRRPDYAKIAQCRQKEGEDVHEYKTRLEGVFRQNSVLHDDNNADGPYQQQLKQALMSGLHQSIADFIKKHNVNHPTDGLVPCMNWAQHAQSIIKNKNKNKKTAETAATYLLDYEEPSQVFFLGPPRGRGRGGRGRGRGRGGWAPLRYPGDRDDSCWRCGKKGHYARDCRAEDNSDQHNEEYKQLPSHNPFHNR
ncbi:uncharacterized protein [Embiotoca jacksoni]|uniref:uncharacterized protein n=1 Tax=Embiotoca jacksoni TaxID=100190 RepID=UPI00370440D9